MSRIQETFSHGKAFIPFITCGDPDSETTAHVVQAMAEAGADLIELGIPFSDPTAEGPVIQAANVRALAAGTTTDKNLCHGSGNLPDRHCAYGLYDLRQRGVFLWHGAFCVPCGGGGNGRADSARHAL